MTQTRGVMPALYDGGATAAPPTPAPDTRIADPLDATVKAHTLTRLRIVVGAAETALRGKNQESPSAQALKLIAKEAANLIAFLERT